MTPYFARDRRQSTFRLGAAQEPVNSLQCCTKLPCIFTQESRFWGAGGSSSDEEEEEDTTSTEEESESDSESSSSEEEDNRKKASRCAAVHH